MNNEICSSDLMGQKLQQLYAMLHMTQRTLDSNESSIYLHEAVEIIGAAAQIANDVEQLRRRMDAELYQQSSKYYEDMAGMGPRSHTA